MMSLASVPTPPGIPEFVRLESKHECRMCGNVLREAMQTSCGHRICKTCVIDLFNGKSDPVPCPVNDVDCEMQDPSTINIDPAERRDIRNLQVYCSNKTHGCPEQMRWHELEAHMASCPYRQVSCPNHSIGCKLTMLPGQVDDHVKDCDYRLEECQYCKELVPFAYMDRHVQTECMQVPLECPYKCDVKPMPRDQLEMHKSLCSNRPKDCPFCSVGCTFKGTEQDVLQHTSTSVESHLQQTFLHTQNMTVRMLEVQNKNQDLQSEIHRLTNHNIKLSGHVEYLQRSDKDMKLKVVTLTERLIHLEKKLEVIPRKDVVDEHDREIRSVQATQTQMKRELQNVERTVAERNRSPPTTTLGPEYRERINVLDSQIANTDIQMAELDLRIQIVETTNYDGTLLWKVRDYRRRKLEAREGRTLSLYSQPFYTHRYGYKMCARVYLNGDGMGKGSHLSLFFVIMKGEYDNLLPWPFQQKVTMVLLDQDSGQSHLTDSFRPDATSSSFRQPTSDMNIASGCPLFVSHTVLETPRYVKDDTLMIKFIVDIATLHHP